MLHFTFSKINKYTIKKYLSIFFIFLLICSLYIYNQRYKLFLNDFQNNFNKHNYSYANNLIISKENTNPYKIIFFKSDLTNYFYNKLDTVNNNLKNKTISDKEALITLREINNYNLISKDIITNSYSLISSLQSSYNSYNKGLYYYNKKNYASASNCFNLVNTLDINYTNAILYNELCTKHLKNNILNQCKELTKKDYYTKALQLLSENNNLFSNNEYNTEVNEIKNKRQNYLDKKSNICEASSKALTSSISPSNINSLNISSNTDYLVNVNIKSQKTYIYKNKNSMWYLIDTFPCSTGISGEDTPCGSFTIKEKGKWFFSQKYKQGGKYWTQITGDILFHSFPYANDQKTILDKTLNKPSSHGCVRLSVDNAKWIYDNIPQNSKVIIK